MIKEGARGCENKQEKLLKRFGSLKQSITFAAAFNAKAKGVRKGMKGWENKKKNVLKTFGSLKQSITFAAAKRESKTFTETAGEGKGKRLKKM